MKINNKWLLSALVLTFSAVFLVPAGMAGAAIDGGYVGSAACGACHTDQYNTFVQSGHPYKVRFTKGLFPVTSGGDNVTTITDPLSALLVGYTPTLSTLSTLNNNLLKVDDGSGRLAWSAVDYVIGGFGWKARWGILDGSDLDGDGVNDTGYIWTGSGAQYNMLTNDYAAYNSGTDKTYSCAICHNTNGTSSVDAGCTTPLGSGRTEPWASSGRTPAASGGFRSEWTFSGVQCEACHGAGETHAGAPTAANIVKNTSKDVCGKCHIRSTNTTGFGGECGGDASPSILTNGAPTTAGSFGSHHQQYNEMVGYNGDGAHASLDCVTCHDPHKRSHKVTAAIAAALGIIDNNQSPEARGAIRKSCSDCHVAQATADAANAAAMVAAHRTNNVTCADCHMAEQTKSATNSPTTGWGRKADVKSHIVKIDPTQTANTRVNADGKTIATNYLTAAFACGKCHDGAIYGSSIAGPVTMAAAQAAAVGYHSVTGIDNGYVGSEACAGCHTQNYNDFVQSGHPYKVRFTKGLDPVLSGGNGTTTITDPLSSILPTPLLSTLSTSSLDGLKVDDGTGHLDWSAASYVIGGFGWKARWGIKDTVNNCNPADSTCKTGYIWTGSGAQFNMLAADTTLDPKGHRSDWSAYNAGTNKTYSCAICHNTNGTSSVDALCTTPLDSGRTEPWASSGLTPAASGGFRSEWTFSGVQCEACHGPAVNHVKSPSTSNIEKNRRVTFDGSGNPGAGGNSYEVCAKCHIRTNNNALGYGGECGGDSHEAILTSGSTTSPTSGFESHHQQFNQVFGYNGDGAHASLECTACHNPHKRAVTVTSAIAAAMGMTDNNLSAEARGAVVSCESCHASGTPNTAGGGSDLKVSQLKYSMGNITCVDCHMASSTQSATSEKATGTTNGVAAWGKSGDVTGHIFKIDPARTAMTRTNSDSKTIATNYITVDYSCGKCHDPYMNDFIGSYVLTQAQAMETAVNIHQSKPTAKFTWSTDSTASYKVNFSAASSICPTGASCTYDWDFGDGNITLGVTATSISHTYADAADRTVTLTIHTQTSFSSEATKTVTPLFINKPPVASFTLSFDANTWTATVTDTSTDDLGIKPNGVTIRWGDGKTDVISAGGSKSHTYAAAATYTITELVIDSATPSLSAISAGQTVNAAAFTVSGTVSTFTGGNTSLANGVLISLMQGGVVKANTFSSTTGNPATYSFANVKAGTYDVRAAKTGYSFAGTNPVSVTVGPNGTANFTLLKTLFKATTTVTATGTGASASGVTVRVYNAGNVLVAQGLTNMSGQYTTGMTLKQGTYTAKGSKLGYTCGDQTFSWANGEPDEAVPMTCTRP